MYDGFDFELVLHQNLRQGEIWKGWQTWGSQLRKEIHILGKPQMEFFSMPHVSLPRKMWKKPCIPQVEAQLFATIQ